MNDIIRILDRGELELIDMLGDDLTVVNSARVSFGKRKDKLDESDIKLIRYLAKNKHYSPFRHVLLQFRVKAPEFVTRQWYKHVVGAETTSSHIIKDHAWNELSFRYVKAENCFFPDYWSKQSANNKQGSDRMIEEQGKAFEIYTKSVETAFESYQKLIDLGVSKEQARVLLPMSLYTEFYWSASFQSIMNFIELRDESHAQYEIREYAKSMKSIMLEKLPISTRVWFDNDIEITYLKPFLGE